MMVYSYDRILENSKNEWITITCINIEEPWKHNVEFKKQLHWDYAQYGSACIKFKI